MNSIVTGALALALNFNAEAQPPQGQKPPKPVVSPELEQLLREHELMPIGKSSQYVVMDPKPLKRAFEAPDPVSATTGATSMFYTMLNGCIYNDDNWLHPEKIPKKMRNYSPSFYIPLNKQGSRDPIYAPDFFIMGKDLNGDNIITRDEVEFTAEKIPYKRNDFATGMTHYHEYLVRDHEGNTQASFLRSTLKGPYNWFFDNPLKTPENTQLPDFTQPAVPPVTEEAVTPLKTRSFSSETLKVDPGVSSMFVPEIFSPDPSSTGFIRYPEKATRADQDADLAMALSEADFAKIGPSDYVIAAHTSRMTGATETKFAPGYIYMIGSDQDGDGALGKDEIRMTAEQQDAKAFPAAEKETNILFEVTDLQTQDTSTTLQTRKNGQVTSKKVLNP